METKGVKRVSVLVVPENIGTEVGIEPST